MTIGFYEPYAINTPHFERCLEIIENHLKKGDDVVFIGCQKEFKTCDVNVFNKKSICTKCTQRCNKGLNLLSKKVKTCKISSITPQTQKKIDDFINNIPITTIEDLKKIKYKNFDIGYAVASSLISVFRNNKPNPKKLKKLLLKFFEDALTIYFSVADHIVNEKIEKLYLFNGRYAHQRAALRAAEYNNINYCVHEVSFSLDKYTLHHNALPHDLENRIRLINEQWSSADKDSRNNIGASFYEDMEKGNLSTKKYYYAKNQKQGLLPSNWNKSKENIVIFNSSDDEFAAIGDTWKQPIYNSQHDGIKQII
ncbi:hypothetical protein OAK19_01665, partial [Aureispira]|nr:hypothetical protein [Aureispira sp.]